MEVLSQQEDKEADLDNRRIPKKIVKDHLVILVHGLHGSVTDLEYVRVRLQKNYSNLITHCATANDGFLSTHEGLDITGARLTEEILQLTDSHPSVKYFSIIGHSLGGLISRYCIGKLYELDYFSKVVPVNYISIATPHVGSRRSSKGVINPVIHWFVNTFLSDTGSQLMLEDVPPDTKELPILVKMSSPDSCFFKGLALFNQRIAYANVMSDLQVPYSTAAMVPRNPYLNGERKLIFSSKYPSIVEDQQDTETSITPSSVNAIDIENSYVNDVKKSQLRMILKNLHSLSWLRVGVCYGNLNFLSHEQIIAKRGWMRTKDDVILHMVDHFAVTPKDVSCVD